MNLFSNIMGLSFKLSAVNEEKKIPREKVIMQIVVGTIVLHNNEYKFKPKGTDELITLSERSYSCKGFKTIYTRALDSHGRPTKIVRCTYAYCTMPSCYIPFKIGLPVKGYILKCRDNIDKFLLKCNEF